MGSCREKGCCSWAINIDPNEEVCDVCYWRVRFEAVQKKLDKNLSKMAEMLKSDNGRDVESK